MNYAKQASRPSPTAMLGALGVPAAFGAVLIAGLAVTVITTKPMPNPTGVLVTPEPIDPLPPEPKPEPSQAQTPNQTARAADPTDFTAPITPIDLGPAGPIADLPDFDGSVGPIGPVDLGIGTPPAPPAPLFDPISASPKGNPGGWVTDNDYRSSWIRREYSGTASFTLDVSASGRVSNCSITQSSGHAALDEATCSLLTRRARFNPAKDSSGKAVSGSFSSAITWKLP
ncbi:MAG: energy transducer TonB [Pseudomonadota bacterium]